MPNSLCNVWFVIGDRGAEIINLLMQIARQGAIYLSKRQQKGLKREKVSGHKDAIGQR